VWIENGKIAALAAPTLAGVSGSSAASSSAGTPRDLRVAHERCLRRVAPV